MLRELRGARRTDTKFCLTLARRGRNVRPYRFADASDSELVYEQGTDVRAGRDVHRPSGRCTDRQTGWLAPARACLSTGRRRSGPEEIGAANAAKTTRGPTASTRMRPSHRLCTVRACATRCSTI